MSDYTALRAALAAGPTGGPWSFTNTHRNGIATVTCCEDITIGPDHGEPGMACYDNHAPAQIDAAYIAAADPVTIAALLAELDEARREVAAWRERAAMKGKP